MDFGIKGKNAIVTGAGQGIGKAVALGLAKEGVNVCVADINEEQGKKAVDDLKALGVKACFIKADASKDEDVVRLFEEVHKELGKVEILVNNAGISPKNYPFDQIDMAEFRKVIDVNLNSIYLLSSTAFQDMKKAGFGRIVSLSSHAGVYGSAIAGMHYGASKGGIIALTKSFARNMAQYNVTVNCVAPGRILTPMTATLDPKKQEAVIQTIPAKRMGSPEEVANVIAFLASVPASYVNGECIEISGGWI